jgi:hypothetical protein
VIDHTRARFSNWKRVPELSHRIPVYPDAGPRKPAGLGRSRPWECHDWNPDDREVEMTLLEQTQQHPPEQDKTEHDKTDHEDRPPEELSTGQLAAHIGELVSRLVRDELTLAQIEAKQRVKRIGVGITAFGFAGGAAFFGSCCLIAAAVLGFSNVLQPWLAAIIVAAALFLLGGFVVMPGWKGMMERRPPIPDDTIESVKADVAAVREALHH